MVGLMKEQVRQSGVADGHFVASTSVHLWSAVLDISDWLPNLIGEGHLTTTPASALLYA